MRKNKSKRPISPAHRFARAPFIAIALLIAGVGVYTRLDGLATRGLEYDEFWTLTHYVPLSVSSILSSLSTPNNHPLNSLLMKWCVGLFGPTPLAMRLPAFAAGILLFIPAALAARGVSGSWTAALVSLALVSSNDAFAHFAQTARGYSLQLLLLASLASLMAAHARSGKDSFQICGGILAFSGFAIFALPTSILFILPMAVIHLTALFTQIPRDSQGSDKIGGGISAKIGDMSKTYVKRHSVMLASYLFFGLCAAIWYGENYSDFKAGQGQFSGLASFGEWGRFVVGVCARISNPVVWSLAFLPFFFRGRRWVAFSAILAAFFPFLLIPFTKAGPSRVYLPIFLYAAVSASTGVALTLKLLSGRYAKRLGTVTLAVVLAAICVSGAVGENKWTPRDWRSSVRKIRETFGCGYCIVYPPNACYAILANYGPEAVVETYARLPRGFPGEKLVVVGSGGFLRGLNPAYQPASISISDALAPAVKRVDGLECRVYNIETAYSADTMPRPSPLLISIHAESAVESKKIRKEMVEVLKKDGVIMCDAWLSRSWLDPVGRERGGYLLACPPTASEIGLRYLFDRFRMNSAVSYHRLR